MNASRQSGFSLIELMVGLVVGSIVLAGAYSLWKTQQTEGYRLGKKIELRNSMTLASKRIQRSVTLAGIGLRGAANLEKGDAVGSDTLVIYTNPGELSSGLASDITHGGAAAVQVDNPSIFTDAEFVVVGTGTGAEIRAILSRNSNTLFVSSSFSNDHPRATAIAMPANRERFYSNQGTNQLVRSARGTVSVVAKDVKNFQVSFRNKRGESTESRTEVRTVQFSFTGIFPAREGALNSMIFSSTAIPRNTL